MELTNLVSFSGYIHSAQNSRLHSFSNSSIALRTPYHNQTSHHPLFLHNCSFVSSSSRLKGVNSCFSKPEAGETNGSNHGQRPVTVEKDVVGLFRNIQKRLRGRRFEENTSPPSNKHNKEEGDVESLLNLLKKITLQSVDREPRGMRTPPTSSFNMNHSDSPPSDQAIVVKDPVGTYGRDDREDVHGSLASDDGIVVKDMVGMYGGDNRDESTAAKDSVGMYGGDDREDVDDSQPSDESTVVHDPVRMYGGDDREDVDDSPPSDDCVVSGMSGGDEREDVDDSPPSDDYNADLTGLRLQELRALAKQRGIKGYSGMKKSTLLELLQ